MKSFRKLRKNSQNN
ncbi:hypothetical protein F383_26835 [Gossypium arboreum]|uniref:Uncharacterized protein n=1 Tax=Gossypium arboreum TaxID=29729 RepID=A0A0B0P7A1_GOSAR|nr:hypothetical protein F383_26835 [Gossypium arboreum]